MGCGSSAAISHETKSASPTSTTEKGETQRETSASAQALNVSGNNLRTRSVKVDDGSSGSSTSNVTNANNSSGHGLPPALRRKGSSLGSSQKRVSFAAKIESPMVDNAPTVSPVVAEAEVLEGSHRGSPPPEVTAGMPASPMVRHSMTAVVPEPA